MHRSDRKSTLCPNCRKIISSDEPRCPYCGISAPNARWKNTILMRGWGSGYQLVRTIIFVNIGFYLFSLFISERIYFNFLSLFNMGSPSRMSVEMLGAANWSQLSEAGWWVLVSANYLHGSVLHIFFNMAALYQIGILITQLFGTYRFFAIYTLSGIGGFLASCFWGDRLTVGASAALCGLIGAALYYGKNRGGTYGQAIYRQIGGWAITILLLGLMFPRVDNAAHIGGMISGALIAAALGYSEKKREDILHRSIAGTCMAVTLLILFWSLLRGFRHLLA